MKTNRANGITSLSFLLFPLAMILFHLLGLVRWFPINPAILVFFALASATCWGLVERPSFRALTRAGLLAFAPLLWLLLRDGPMWTYSWHNLMQIDAIYAWQLNAGNLFYAHSSPGYPYLGLIPLANFASWLDSSPYIVSTALNGVMFCGLIAAYTCANSDKFKQAPAVSTMASSAALFYMSGYVLLTMEIGPTLTTLLQENSLGLNIKYLTEPRVSFDKFLNIDSMTIGLCSLALQLYFHRYSSGRFSPMLSALFGAQTALCYPLLAPVAAAIPFSRLIMVRRIDLWQIGTLILVLAAFMYSQATVSAAKVNFGLTLNHWAGGAAFRGLTGLLVAAPMWIPVVISLGFIGAWKQYKEETFIFSLCLLAFMFANLPFGVQYKFLYGAIVILGFGTARVYVDFFTGQNRRLAGILFYLMGAVLLTAELSNHKVGNLANSAQLLDSHYLVSTDASQKITALLRAKGADRSNTLIVSDVAFPASTMLRIPQYFNLDESAQTGYTMTYEQIVTEVMGYDHAEFLRRQQITKAILYGNAGNSVAQLKVSSGKRFITVLSKGTATVCEGHSTMILSDPNRQPGDINVCVL
jgi:hypothetical protein